MPRSTRSKYFNGKLYTRMAEDLHLGGKSERTHAGYLRAVRKLAEYCQTSPDKVTEDQLRRFFLYMKNELHYAYGTLAVAYSGIKFFFRSCLQCWVGTDSASAPPIRADRCDWVAGQHQCWIALVPE